MYVIWDTFSSTQKQARLCCHKKDPCARSKSDLFLDCFCWMYASASSSTGPPCRLRKPLDMCQVRTCSGICRKFWEVGLTRVHKSCIHIYMHVFMVGTLLGLRTGYKPQESQSPRVYDVKGLTPKICVLYICICTYVAHVWQFIWSP